MKPYFSLIIPVAPDRGAEVLRSIDNLDYPKSKYEIIVERGLNPSRNRNRGAEKARGKILCFLDDDAVVDRDLLKNAYRMFENTKWRYWGGEPVSIAGGPQLTPIDDPFFAKACGEAFGSYFGAFSMSNRYKQGQPNYNADENSLTSANMFVRADVYKKIGGFNENLFPGEDPEFLARAKKKGFRIAYDPDLIIYHRRRSTLWAFVKQFFNYGKVRIKKEEIGGTNTSLIYMLPAFFALYMIFLPTFIALSPRLGALPIILYMLIAFIASMPAVINKDVRYIYILPILFFLVHFSYGCGILYGLIRKWL